MKKLLISGKILRFCIDYSFTLEIQNSLGTQIWIKFEEPFFLKFSSSKSEKIIPAEIQLISDLKRLLNEDLIEFTPELAHLKIETKSGIVLTADSHPDYESWCISTSKGGRVVCLPGGELATWSEVE